MRERTGPQQVRDLWLQMDIGKQADGFSADIPRHGVMLIRVSGEPVSGCKIQQNDVFAA